MTLDDAVKFALERNLDIAVQRLNPAAAGHRRRDARGPFYRPTLTSSLESERHNVNAPTSQLQLSSGGGGVTNRTFTYNAGVTKNFTFGGGAARGARSTTAGRRPTATTRFYNPQFNSDLERSNYTQPLLRDFRIDTQRRQLHRLAGEPRHLRRPAARLDDQPRLERAQRLLGLRLHDAGRRGRAAVARAGDQARAGQPDPRRGRHDGADRRRAGAGRAGDAPAGPGHRRERPAHGRARAEAPDRLRHRRSELGGHARPGGSPGFPARAGRHRSGDSARAQPAHRSRDRARRTSRTTTTTLELPAQPDAADRRPAGELRRAGRRRPVSRSARTTASSAARSPQTVPGGIARRALVAVREPVSALDGAAST